jgi:ArsR family metal-binding transcriptional regulator
MEIYKLLNGSNCRECNEKTCLAFAVAVFKGKKPSMNIKQKPLNC